MWAAHYCSLQTQQRSIPRLTELLVILWSASSDRLVAVVSARSSR